MVHPVTQSLTTLVIFLVHFEILIISSLFSILSCTDKVLSNFVGDSFCPFKKNCASMCHGTNFFFYFS